MRGIFATRDHIRSDHAFPRSTHRTSRTSVFPGFFVGLSPMSLEKENPMRALLLSTVALATLAGSAFAADLPSRKEAPVYVAPAPAFSWTGFYIGGDIGGAFTSTSVSATGLAAYEYATHGLLPGSLGSSGFMGGGYVGYNYQLNQNFVLGLEGDFQGTSNSKSYTANNDGAITLRRRPAWIGSPRSTAASASPMTAPCSTPSAARPGPAPTVPSAPPMALSGSAIPTARPCPASTSAPASNTPSPRTGWAASNIATTTSATPT